MSECCTLDVVSVRSTSRGCTCGGVIIFFLPIWVIFELMGVLFIASGEPVGFAAWVFPLAAVSAVRACTLLPGGWYFYDFHWERQQSRSIKQAFSFPLHCRSFINRENQSLPASRAVRRSRVCRDEMRQRVSKKVGADSQSSDGPRFASSYYPHICCSFNKATPPAALCFILHLNIGINSGIPVTRNSEFRALKSFFFPSCQHVFLACMCIFFGLSSKHQKIFRSPELLENSILGEDFR